MSYYVMYVMLFVPLMCQTSFTFALLNADWCGSALSEHQYRLSTSFYHVMGPHKLSIVALADLQTLLSTWIFCVALGDHTGTLMS